MSDPEIRDGLISAMIGEPSKPTDQRFKSLIQELFSLVQELFAENDTLKESVAYIKSLEEQLKSKQERIESLEEALRLLASSQLSAETVPQMQTKIRRAVSEALQVQKDTSNRDIELDSTSLPE